MTEATPTATVFKYEKPEFGARRRQFVRLARTDRMIAAIQAVKEGGENNLHSHAHQDGFWMILKGRARFYGDGNTVLGDFGPYEGILVPRGFKYWFESSGDEDLEILQVEAFDIALPDDKTLHADRINHEATKAGFSTNHNIAADRRL